ncbi:MAG: FHA domain-containing protein [Burkholderiales bacterium]
MLSAELANDEITRAGMQARVAVVLKPLSHPDLNDLRIEKSLAIGRAAQPFATYAHDIVVDLSRRHARIVCANGSAYVADLGSKNGTTVNRKTVRTNPHALRDGDEICFGGALTYRVELGLRAMVPGQEVNSRAVTLTPEQGDLHPIVIRRFPFLIGKTVDVFSRYRQEQPQQLHYLSRRHAHVFLKDGLPFIEDLGSTNGTFIDGKRLDERAVPLQDGALVALGGHHFAYRVHLEQAPHVDVVMMKPAVEAATIAQGTSAGEEPTHLDRTTFVASASSFLDIFCADHAKHVAGVEEHAKLSSDAVQAQDRHRERSRFAIVLSELRQAFGGADRIAQRRTVWLGASGAMALALIVLALYLFGASERELKDLVAGGAYGKAATLASERLQREPDNVQLKALATEAILKAHVPEWLNRLKARDFVAASTVLAGMKALGRHSAEFGPLMVPLEWIGDLESLVIGRGGVEAPIRIYADEEGIRAILKRWDDDSQGHQRGLARIAAHVREFKGHHAEVLTHLRKLQSDSLVHLAAIDRLKSAISTELHRNAPEALQPVLQEYAEKYPRLGLEGVREDLRQYLEVESLARARSLSRLAALQRKVRFSTPPFAEQYRALKASDRLPPADVIQQVEAVSRAWREGDTTQAFSGSKSLVAGPWADAAARELARKKMIFAQFSGLQKSRGTHGYSERLLTFHGALDPDEDLYFVRAIEADVDLHKNKAIARAQELLNRAEGLWHRYRENGVIEGRQRLEAGISNQFRAQALMLSEANELAQQGVRIYTQLRAARPSQWNRIHEEIKAEAALQRTSLLELRNVLEPGLLKAKLALIGGRSDDERKSI